MRDRLIVFALALVLAYLLVGPLIERVAHSLDDSANRIAEVSRGQR